ncbi:NAD-dependent epimerase/dehydratase family protein [Phototrophicus methaneseepsis]|uniref:NAD-dependent epimerase/dehydratase family protein n=1 Tax=Phototrophicus methaneseepsis TaxID=2710758 RepID=A0A7S8IF47_9CHLR|nr:NAD-dependent epimerase/dehydratase family protein [Phototrophicus methaneseepsis]QPC83236.1 NAD-dependent epimerase/dehydratase family protein [Phototrophicus methaneseepsis]
MHALVTGGTGFVGSHIVRTLNEAGHTVRVLHRTTSKLDALTGLDYESAIGDVTDLNALRAACAGVDWVFHVAAVADYWRANVQHMADVNIEGTRKVLRAARESGVQRVIFTSSAAAVGLGYDQPSDEEQPFNMRPQHFPYGYTKARAEAVVAEAVAAGQDVVTVNPAVIMGPGDLNMISGTFVVQLWRYRWLAPATYGGIAVIDVRDVARLHLAAAEKGRTGQRYILSTANYTYETWFGMIADALGIAPPTFYIPTFLLPIAAGLFDLARWLGINTPIDADQVRLGGRYVYFDNSKCIQELGTPQINMQQSLEDTVAWYRKAGYLESGPVQDLLATIEGLWTLLP